MKKYSETQTFVGKILAVELYFTLTVSFHLQFAYTTNTVAKYSEFHRSTVKRLILNFVLTSCLVICMPFGTCQGSVEKLPRMLKLQFNYPTNNIS